MTTGLKEYIVTLKNYNELDQFYHDMQTEGTSLSYVPSRSVQCVSKRPTSRNTHYLLTDSEAKTLFTDPRVEFVSRVTDKVFKKDNFSSQTATWDRGPDVSAGQRNWGLYRMQIEENISTWGSGSTEDAITSSINFTATGKNVDIVIVDEVLYPNHPEFTGRVVGYDWFRQHDLAVRGSATTIVNVSRTTNIATITTEEPHRISKGAVVDVVCTSDSAFNVTAAIVTDVVSDTKFQYANVGPTVISSAGTGFWRGVYQYPSYTGSNNHATAVAGVIAGATNGWARSANIYNLRHDSTGLRAGEYTPADLLIDYIRQFHSTKPINQETGRRNPTLVNNSWGFVNNLAFSNNIYTGNPNYSRLNYRGNYVTGSGEEKDTGLSGVFSATNTLGSFVSIASGTAYTITTDSTPTAIITPIEFTENGPTGLTALGAPTGSGSIGIDINDDAIWRITNLPFSIEYAGTSYNSITVGSNSFIVPGTPFLNTNSLFEFSATYPAVNKLLISSGDRNVKNIRTGSSGTAPNRTYIVRFEGWDGAYGSTSLEEPANNLIWEAVFYEATPNRIDVRIIKNAAWRSEFTISELNSYGARLEGPPVPVRIPSLDADIADAIAEGIIFVGAAGNSSYKVESIGGVDYNNYIVENGEAIYYHRGSSPANSHPAVISVGALDSASFEPKSPESNTGPGVDLYAPGVNIISAVFDDTGNLSALLNEGENKIFQKWSGSSIAAAQVTGILALALESYPNMTPAEAKAYILHYSKAGRMANSGGGYMDNGSLQGGPNKIAFLHKERPDTGTMIPKVSQRIRPSTGQLYPRPVIRKK